jgi:hypothetical protein
MGGFFTDTAEVCGSVIAADSGAFFDSIVPTSSLAISPRIFPTLRELM